MTGERADALRRAYPGAAIAGDLVRAAAGAGLAAAPLALLELNLWVAGVLAALTALFAYFGLLTLLRSRMRIRVDDEAIAVVSPWPACATAGAIGTRSPLGSATEIQWSRLDAVTLNYYATGSRSEQGWMHIVLRSGKARITLDSRVPGFEDIARRALDAARANHVLPGPVTLANFRSLGVVSEPPGAADAADREGAAR